MPILDDACSIGNPYNVCYPSLTAEIDGLVDEIRETLLLKANRKQRALNRSPYGRPSKKSKQLPKYPSRYQSRDFGKPCSCRSSCECLSSRMSTYDSHILLSNLLKEGTLISEAVNRLKKTENANETGNRYQDFYDSSDHERCNFENSDTDN